MNTEELRDHAKETLHFDAHEFDGLREVLEQEAEGMFTQVDQFIREHPVLCLSLAAAAGFAVAAAIGSRGSKTSATE